MSKVNKNKIFSKYGLFCLVFMSLLFICSPKISFALVSPKIIMESSVTTVGENSDFTINILLSTDNQRAVNAFDLKIKYLSDEISYIDFDNSGSIVNIWPELPNATLPGQITISGAIIEPFTAEQGLITKLHFRAKDNLGKLSLVKFVIEDNNLYLANGLGTKIKADTSPFFITTIASVEILGESPVIESPAKLSDITPPTLIFKMVRDPISDSLLGIFQAKDKESGIRSIEVRSKVGFRWSQWKQIENIASFSLGTWAVEVRVTNNSGLIKVEKDYLWREFTDEFRFPIISLLIIIVIGFSIFIHYRKVYNKYKKNLYGQE